MPIPVRERGYAHPELLAETDWLAGCLSDPTVRVVDARADKDYAGGHIPGAVNLMGFSLTWSGHLESTRAQRSSCTTGGGPRRRGWSPGRSSTTATPIPVTSMVGWRSGPPRGCRFPTTSRPTNRGRSQLAWWRRSTAPWTRRRPPSMTTASSSGTCAASASSRGRRRGGMLRPGSGTCRELSTWIGPSFSIPTTGR